ncbi:MAG: hypothetical protein KJO66_03960, partial [Gammaproteobacteria bacterium]|nr:hypothetical protein [Gammaproteobacteria bacterium]
REAMHQQREERAAQAVEAAGEEGEATMPEGHRQYREAMQQQRGERAAARQWRGSRDRDRVARMEDWLKQQEERQQHAIQRYETMRNRAEEEHNYLVQHYEDMLNKALQDRIEVANRHEEMRRDAEKRRKRLAAFRVQLKDMTPEERRDYMDTHREELFGNDETMQSRDVPGPYRHGGKYRRPAPAWNR